MRLLSVLLVLACSAVAQQGTTPPPESAATHHVFLAKDQLQWSAMAIPHMQMAVVSGDPKGTGPFVLRIRAQQDQRIPAHWHPTDENLTVIAGTMSLGTGDKYSKSALRQMKPGDYGYLPKETRHFAWFNKGGEVQLHGMGPFVINWVDPEEVKAVQAEQGKPK